MPPTRSVAKADVAELSAALDSAVDAEKAHHLVIVGTNKVLSTTQFKQMFYSRGDDFFQIANVYECPDSCNSVHSSVWGIDCKDPHDPNSDNAPGLVAMKRNRLTSDANALPAGYSIQDQNCFNFNKLGGRENDPKGCAWAYSYAHDADRNFYAQHEVMGYLEKDTCVKRDFWTACSRMSIEDQLYGLAFASETDQDLCMAVTCARRWSEVEDALAESCTAADKKINNVPYKYKMTNLALQPNTNTPGNIGGSGSDDSLKIEDSDGNLFFNAAGITANGTMTQLLDAINTTTPTDTGNANWTTVTATENVGQATPSIDIEFCLTPTFGYTATGGGLPTLVVRDGATGSPGAADDDTVVLDAHAEVHSREMKSDSKGHIDLYINVRVSNGHPKALDTILRVRFTVAYAFHEPSALNTWNTRASTAASGVIQSGVVGDAPEGGKEQHEDTTVVA